ncbi:beta-ketoacyl synthase chain length factor [Actinokineospora sp. NPDC004072]
MTGTLDRVAVLAEARWSGPDAPAIAGFVVSNFNPMVAEVARRCFAQRPPRPRTGVVLASVRGDTATAAAIAAAVAAGRRVPPLLFFQSNPNAVLGHIAARWGLIGPLVCASPTGEPLADALACAELLADEADEVLVITADLARTPDDTDQAHALLVTPVEAA